MAKELTYILLKNFIINVIQWKLLKRYPLKPIFFTHYLTLRCNFKCNYCRLYGEKNEMIFRNELNTKNTLNLLKIIKKESEHIYFTGGEPLLRRDLITILSESRRIKFKTVAVNTNMSLVDEQQGLLDHITSLVASLDSMNKEKYAKILGVNKIWVERVIRNILDCASLQKEKKYILTVNCVITPKTVQDVREVMDFCFSNNIRFAVVPAELSGGRPDPRLKTNYEYQSLIKDIIKAKNQGLPVFGSMNYLRTIYDFRSFECFAMLTPHTYPNGDLFYPCQPKLTVAANLLKKGSYKKALKQGIKSYGSFTKCGNRCHKACYIEPSSFVRHPTLIFKEFSKK